VTHRKKGSLSAEVEVTTSRVRWAGLEDQYFAMIAIPAEPVDGVATWAVERVPRAVEPPDEEVEPEPQALVALAIPPEGATLFVGPKKYHLLDGLGNDLGQAVWFSSNAFLAWISRQIFLGLLWLHDHVVPNYGVAIVLATLLLRVLLFPVNQYSMVSMKKAQLQMQRLQPKVKVIRAKYKKAKDAENRARMNQEMMDMYKREGVNPMGGLTGCLPLLAQFPILIGFYNMLTVAVELRGADFFGWINDLSRGDPWYVLPVLMGATMFLQQKLAMSKVKDPMQLQQQRMMMFMPVFFTYICLWMPSGMVLYWFVNNVLGIGQQWLVNRHTSRLEAAAAQKA
jgi:YidC/Oxa1 family membrane protein insertase